MTHSLSDAYEHNSGEFESLTHLYAGTMLFIIGLLAVIVATVLSTIDPVFSLSINQQWTISGVLAGVGLPTTFVGVLVLFPSPSKRATRAFVGVAVSLIAVLLFVYAFPNAWYGDTPNYSVYVIGLYLIGSSLTFSQVFLNVADFKERNDPVGTVELEVVREGKTEVVEVEESAVREYDSSLGFIGNQPRDYVETQTNTTTSSNETETQPTPTSE
jgi:hypothetical protein